MALCDNEPPAPRIAPQQSAFILLDHEARSSVRAAAVELRVRRVSIQNLDSNLGAFFRC
jgi:hypothetical protein